MARNYTRPDLGERLLVELVPDGTTILINPTFDELTAALADLQVRVRRNRLDVDQLQQLFEMHRTPGFFSASISTAEEAPDRYGYDYPSTQAGACWLGDGIVGFVLKRALTPPGDSVLPPLYDRLPTDPGFDAQDWLESICTTFWTRLTDEELSVLDQAAIRYEMMLAARRREEASIRAEERRSRRRLRDAECQERLRRAEEEKRQQLASLFRGVEPVYTTNVSELCRTVAESLRQESKDGIPWREFKRRWPAIADRHADDILPVVEDGWVRTEALSGIQGPRTFSLSFGLWTGSQRLFAAPQIVFRVEAMHLLLDLTQTGTVCRGLVTNLWRLNRSASLVHPNADWTVGWLRVHVDDDNRIMFVDEVQSDTLERLRTVQQGEQEAGKLIEKQLQPWNLHGFASVHHWAKAIGYRVALHSKESSVKKPGMTRSERKWNQYYQPIIKQFELQRETVPGYPAPIMVGSQTEKKRTSACHLGT